MLNGSCLCGAIRYTISAPVSELRAMPLQELPEGLGRGGQRQRRGAELGVQRYQGNA